MVSALDARLFVAPFTDSTCGALLEAMALGKPCIVPERGVLTEIVTQGVDGLVVRDDSLAISGAIVRLASTPRLRRNLGANAREKIVRDFSLENQASLVDDLYRSLVALRPRKTKLRALLRARPTRK
jgi:glycosyltransferase involved in cell wall biosynthesis